MTILDTLKSLGYDVKVKEDNIRLSYKGQGTPDKNRVLPLIEELKVKKNEIIKELRLEDLYLETMHEINDSYIEGAIIFIEKNYPELDAKIDEVDKQINKIWESCHQGKTGLDDFRNVLALYEKLYFKAIDLYKRQLDSNSDNCEIL